MVNNEIVVLSGFSGVGKDTIANYLKESGYSFIVSDTTRPIRDNESEGNPYNFLTKEEFNTKILNNEYIEYRKYHTLVNNKKDEWLYGTNKNQIKDNVKYVCVLDITGLKELKKSFNHRIKSIFLDAPDEVRKQRSLERGSFDETEWNRRLKDDIKNFNKDDIEDITDIVIINTNLSNTMFKLNNFLNIKV